MFDSILAWRLRTPFYYGWLVLVITATSTFAATGASQVVLGGIQVYITEDTGWSSNTISFAASVGTWCSGLLAPFIGRLADRYGPRWLVPFGLVFTGACFFFISGFESVWQFYVGYIVARALTNEILIGLVPRTSAVNFFRRRRNMALATVSTFRPIASAINIQIISLIAVHQGWRIAYRYLGILSLVLVVPVVLFMRRRPEDIGLLPDGAPQEVATSGSGIREPDQEDSWTAGQAVKTRTFWLIVVTASLGTMATSSIGFSLVPYLVEGAGLTKGAAAGMLSLGTFLSITNLGWGYLADVFTPRRCLMLTLVGSAGMIAYLITVDSLAGALGFAVAWGVFSGAVGSLEYMVLAQYYGRASYGSILGVSAPFQTVALGLGPALTSTVRAATGDYTTLYVVMIAAYSCAVVLIILARPPVRTVDADDLASLVRGG